MIQKLELLRNSKSEKFDGVKLNDGIDLVVIDTFKTQEELDVLINTLKLLRCSLDDEVNVRAKYLLKNGYNAT